MFGVPDETVAPRHARDGVKHDLRALAAEERADEAWLPVVPETEDRITEHGDQVRVRHLRCEVTDEDAVLFGILRVLDAGNGDRLTCHVGG